MLLHLAVALLQVATPAPSQSPATAAPERDSTTGMHRDKKPPKRIVVTGAHLATAYRDPAARSILLLAREARMRQDSALTAYDATTYQRVSAGLGFRRLGRDRLAFRSEGATRVRWRRGVGAYVDVTGSRTVIPIAGKSARANIEGSLSPVPYYPGSETLWIGASAARQAVDENEGIVHPLAEGSEAYYVYESGDSAAFRLPDGRSIRLRELRIRPRTPKWNLAVGSLWFDMSGGQLVRAAYRMSVPMDIKAVAEEDDSASFDDVPRVIKPMLFPMKAEISAVGVEYGLYQGRFWLPRMQIAQGGAQVGVMRIPFKLEQKFAYERVNAGEPLPPIPVRSDSAYDSTSVAITIAGEGGRAARDAERTARRMARTRCDSSGVRTRVRTRNERSLRVLITTPCDSTKLANSPDLPPSIYDTGEQVVASAEIEALVNQALAMGSQASFAPAPPTLAYAPLRYNRIEALSVGGMVEQQLGAGYSWRAVGRIGVADREPNLEVTGSRSDLRRTLSLTAYNRLVSASDWGNPLGLGPSIVAFAFGRDDGFYYRASGLELSRAPDQRGALNLTWSLFAEQERNAPRKTTFSLAQAMGGSEFGPNITTTSSLYAGARTRLVQSVGEDPQGFRLFNDLRLEAAHGDTGTYGRVALDVTASHGVGNGAVSLTVAGGTSVGVLPIQRNWFLGGTHTVRGVRPGTAVGNAFWMARGEAGYGFQAARPLIFGDIGWAGDRTKWQEIGTPLAGVGAGISILDGLVRFDVARGLQPSDQRGWRVETYLEGRF
jgi:hypothetical protein